MSDGERRKWLRKERIKRDAALRKAEDECDNLVLISGSKEGGACRRASMDLTRALADLRRP